MPVAVGTGVAEFVRRHDWGHDWWRVALALVVSLALQIGVNYANDYSDGVRGTDDAGLRVGPPRLVGWKLASPKAVKAAALMAFGVAAIAGLGLAVVTSWWLLGVGAAAIAAAWFYTGGPRPYGYSGLGEVFVFVFFGLVAVVGTAYVQLERIPSMAWWCGTAVGLLAVALLVTNNLRDIPGDTKVGKRTLAVRLGDVQTRWLYGVCIAVPFILVLFIARSVDRGWPLLALLAVAAAIDPLRRVWNGAAGRELIAVLGATAKLQWIFGALLTLGLWFSARHIVGGIEVTPAR